MLLTIAFTAAVTNLLDTAFNSVLVPVRTDESGNGPGAIGLLGSVRGIAAAYAHRLRRRLVFFTGFPLAGAPRFLVLAHDAPMGAVLAVFALSGFGVGFVDPVLGAVLFERIPRRMPGRVKALTTSLAWAGMPLGGLIAGAAVAPAGLVPVLLGGGAVPFLTTNLAGLRPEWRQMDRAGGHGTGEPQPEKPRSPVRSPERKRR